MEPIYQVDNRETVRERFVMTKRMVRISGRLYKQERNSGIQVVLRIIAVGLVLLAMLKIEMAVVEPLLFSGQTVSFVAWMLFWAGFLAACSLPSVRIQLALLLSGYYGKKKRREGERWLFGEEKFGTGKEGQDWIKYSSIHRIWEDSEGLYLFFGPSIALYLRWRGISGPDGADGFRRFLKERWERPRTDGPAEEDSPAFQETVREREDAPYVICEVWDEEWQNGLCAIVRRRNWRIWAAVMAVALAYVVFREREMLFSGDGLSMAVGWGIVGCLWAVCAVTEVFSNSRKRILDTLRKNNNPGTAGQHITYWAGGKGIFFNGNAGNGCLPYQAIRSAKETKEGFVVRFRGNKGVLYIRKSSFTQGDPACFLSFLRGQMEETKRKKDGKQEK